MQVCMLALYFMFFRVEFLMLTISTRTLGFHDFTYILSVVLFSHVVFIIYSCVLLCCLVRNKLID